MICFPHVKPLKGNSSKTFFLLSVHFINISRKKALWKLGFYFLYFGIYVFTTQTGADHADLLGGFPLFW